MKLRLQHIHLPGLTRYAQASIIQDRIVNRLLAWKAVTSANSPSFSGNPSANAAPPEPSILTVEFHPIYTCGRREISSISQAQIDLLRGVEPPQDLKADFQTALRGGQTTFHGPGQLVAYPIIDIRRFGITPRCYVNMLEETTIKLCERHGVQGIRTENPGVWVKGLKGTECKIAAVGVHLRRNVTSHGIGFNVNTDLHWFKRAIMCGLEGKEATSLRNETGNENLNVRDIAMEWVTMFASGLSATYKDSDLEIVQVSENIE